MEPIFTNKRHKMAVINKLLRHSGGQPCSKVLFGRMPKRGFLRSEEKEEEKNSRAKALKSVRRCREKACFQNGSFNRLGQKLAGKKDKIKPRLTSGVLPTS